MALDDLISPALAYISARGADGAVPRNGAGRVMQRGPWPKCLRSAACKESLGTPSRHPISRRTAPRSEQRSCQPRASQVPQSSNHTPPLPSAACRIRAVGKEKIRRCLPAHQEHESLVAHDVEDAWVNHMHTAISSFATTFHKSNYCIATDLLKLLHDICFACPWDHLAIPSATSRYHQE